MVQAKKWVLVKKFDGFPKDSDLELQIEEVSEELKDGEIFCEALYLSVDPYMRPYSARMVPEGSVMIGQQVAKVTKSKHKDYPVGTEVIAHFGWRTHTVVNVEEWIKPIPGSAPRLYKVSKQLSGKSLSLALGALGLTGLTAYFGTVRLLEPKKGDVLFVNAAAGATGSIVGQIGKIKGCKVIGCAGSEQKCDWLRQLGFDHVFNYKTDNFVEELKKAAPNGIDCFFDNVGGCDSAIILRDHMNYFGRISVCGAISYYNTDVGKEPGFMGSFISKQLKMEGFLVYRWFSEIETGMKDLAQWIQEGKLQYKEDMTKGFDNMRQTFYGLFTGANTGKAIIKV